MKKTYEDFIKENQKSIRGYHNEYIKEQCRTCFNAIVIGTGTKNIDNNKMHFDSYGCDFDSCKYE